ncbi:MAG TPA: polysaccharide biosynthesis tyrosine autokinase [Stellaceae bacterium]|nr:polysaccharide biosynthesis tyrosine autokinase [Stellaceae bacterium]
MTFSSPRDESDGRSDQQIVGPDQRFGGPPTGGTPVHDRPDWMEIPQLIAVIRRRWGMIVGSTALLTLLAAIVVFQLPPRYTADATVMLDTRTTKVVDIQAVVSGLYADAAVVRSELEVLRSPALTAKVIEKLDLTKSKVLNPYLQPTTFFDRYNPAALVRHMLENPAAQVPLTPEQQKQTELEATIQTMLTDLTVLNDGRSYIIKILFQCEDPALAQAVANAYADLYLAGQLDLKYAATQRATDWLNEQLAGLRDKARDSDQAVQRYREEHNLTDVRGTTVTTQQLSEINSQLILAAADRAQKEAALKQLQDAKASGNVDSVAQVLNSATIITLKNQQSDLRRRRAELLTRYKPAHPEIINIDAQIADIDKKLAEEIGNVTRSMANDVQVARSREASLRQSLAGLQNSQGKQTQEEVRLHELQREADANRQIYENFLTRFKQVSTQEDMQQADAHLIARAQFPTIPTYPKKQMLIGLWFFISLCIGVGGAFAMERLDNGFRSPEQIEQLTGVPFIGLVPTVPMGKRAHDLVVQQPVSSYAEAIRSVRTALHFTNVDAPPKIVLVTSSVPKEGKSVFSTSLARSVARSGGRALIIDCDLRHPTVSKLLEAPKVPGLLAYFADGTDPAQLIQVEEQSRLHYIPVREGASNPQDLLGSQQMKNLLEGLRDQYDLIVLDAPPVLAVSDALVLSHLVDATLFLIRWEETPRSVAMGALKLLRGQGTGLAGFVLTRVNVRKHAKYGYGDSGYYYGRYGSYYGSKAKA